MLYFSYSSSNWSFSFTILKWYLYFFQFKGTINVIHILSWSVTKPTWRLSCCKEKSVIPFLQNLVDIYGAFKAWLNLLKTGNWFLISDRKFFFWCVLESQASLHVCGGEQRESLFYKSVFSSQYFCSFWLNLCGLKFSFSPASLFVLSVIWFIWLFHRHF